ncbi:MAG: hypothetical protein LQ350_007753 [Teloschistes chrysophthalmus]|nr:MAG: hypothetical protein LQ350_007753 [Niorma chrysophthalma]
MASKNSLYGVPRPNSGLHRSKEISSSTSLAFTSQLSSLLAQQSASTTQPTSGRARPSKTKEDIFKTHNKNTKKRALADISSSDGTQKASKQDIGGIDPADLHRSKRKMEEKARLYASMKRGDYVPPSGGSGRSAGHNAEEHSLVDFDRKWAEKTLEKEDDGANDHNTSSGEDDDDDDDDDDDSQASGTAESLVDYEDEFGRLRRITKTERTRLTRIRNASAYAASELASYTARPTAPTNIIHGDTIQSAAFNPDITISQQMEELARKRDSSLTPPPDEHYDASKEIRSKGVGFYAFSRDEGERKREMEELERVRGETERVVREREERAERRKREVEERRKVVGKKREERLAERFLRELG